VTGAASGPGAHFVHLLAALFSQGFHAIQPAVNGWPGIFNPTTQVATDMRRSLAITELGAWQGPDEYVDADSGGLAKITLART
jgi:hypothetical protein